jgi:hypothetical protein
MSSLQFSFFATRADMLAVAGPLEEHFALKYVELGLFEKPSIPQFNRLSEIPGVGFTRSPGAPTIDAHYLLVPLDSEVQPRSVPQRKGGVLWSVDMQGNPESIEVSPGGIYLESPKILVLGRCATLGSTVFSREVYGFLLSQVKHSYRRNGWVYVGPEAASNCRHGWRLVRDSRLPESHDLVLGN